MSSRTSPLPFPRLPYEHVGVQSPSTPAVLSTRPTDIQPGCLPQRPGQPNRRPNRRIAHSLRELPTEHVELIHKCSPSRRSGRRDDRVVDPAEIDAPASAQELGGPDNLEDQFVFVLRDNKRGIFVWDHETDGRDLVAGDLESYLTHALPAEADWYRNDRSGTCTTAFCDRAVPLDLLDLAG
jgi:hypothetical protein